MATGPAYTTSFRRNNNGTYTDARGRVISGNAINRYTGRFNDLASTWANLKAGDANYDATARQIQNIGRRYGFNAAKVLGGWKPGTAATTTPTPAAPVKSADPIQAPTVPTATATQPAAPAALPIVGSKYTDYQSPMTAALLKAMGEGMNTMQAYEPKSFEGSPLYQFQKQKGMQDLEKLMAARGLTGSGAEIQANSDFLANLNAQEAEKQRQYADATAQRQQNAMQFIANFDQNEKNALRDQWNTDLNRQTNINQFEANRGDRRQELATNFLSNILGLQSQNDIARMAQNGLLQQTSLSDQLMKALANYTANDYTKAYGGGGGAPPVAPSSGNADILSILMNYGNRAGNNDVTDGILRLFGSGK